MHEEALNDDERNLHMWNKIVCFFFGHELREVPSYGTVWDEHYPVYECDRVKY